MLLTSALLMGPAMMACGDKGADDSGATGDGGSVDATSELVYTDANNYSYTADLQIDSQEVAAGADSVVDWSGLAVDMRGRAVDPAGVDRVMLVAFNISKDDVIAAINSNSLLQSDVRVYYQFDNTDGVTSASLSDFSILGNEFNPAQDMIEHPGETWTWLVSVMDEANGRIDVLSTTFVDPLDSSSNRDIAFGDDTAVLHFSVDLHSADPLVAIAGEPDTSFNWAAATTEASGQPFDEAKASRLLVGHIRGATISDVEANVLTVLDTADELFYADAYGKDEILLSEAVERTTGANFAGFDTDGVWLVGIECTNQTCLSPAPLIMTVVEAQ
ncbi:MAG: hypothetical protein D6798_13445 [Deltaproteobacteria bacterium]|nr:MAG: hypothetical protein D6798_13445 [Deltaproteobacteria bacterium]